MRVSIDIQNPDLSNGWSGEPLKNTRADYLISGVGQWEGRNFFLDLLACFDALFCHFFRRDALLAKIKVDTTALRIKDNPQSSGVMS